MIEAIVDALLETIGETIYRTFSWLFGRGGTDSGAQGDPLDHTCLEAAE